MLGNYTVTWANLKAIMLSDKRQRLHTVIIHVNLGKAKIQKEKTDQQLPEAMGQGGSEFKGT